ncbi:protein YIF1B-A-like isoform X2 [Homarus americanus]|uniref:Protein YIF1 n=1 Tax=Homarus americanus TaxID=6706 RepID=A0A8J5MKL7_HOMAM|nr:protein YIF1B-A-like isoform X2 [Homarus americanus]KAG7154988.1 YIF1B-B-like [Homarus americanus]
MDYSIAGGRQPRGRRVASDNPSSTLGGGDMQENMYDQYGQPRQQQAPPQLFEDTSGQNYDYGNQGYGGMNYGYPPPGQPNQGASGGYGAYPGAIPGPQIFQDPLVANMAMQYGQSLASQGREYVDKKLEKYVSMSQVKYYFAVDTPYVMKKLRLLFFPFTHSDWSVRYEQDEPVQPRHEINAPDLYIPLMAVVTYILVAGLCLGLQERFSPDVLGMQASSALVWLVLEIFVIFATLYVTAIQTHIKSLDLLAFSSYKYVGMIVALLAGLVMQSLGYYCVLAYSSFSLVVFMFRTLRWQVQGGAAMEAYSAGNKRRLYLLLFMSGLQPLMMWWLTKHLVAV